MGSKHNKTSDRSLKRVRNEENFPLLESRSNTDYITKFFVVHAEDASKPLSKMSPFLVAKVLKGLLGEKFNCKKMFTGDLLVEVFEKNQAVALQCLNHIQEAKVTVSAHRTLNTVRGVISEDDLMDCPVEEILEGMHGQAVVAAKRITIRRDGKEIPTKHIILTFELNSIPSSVKAGYLNCKVRPYVPNPIRCFRCQRFGHGSRSCRGRETCAKCGRSEHTADDCHEDPKCVNCKGNHPAYSRSCDHFKKEKEILTLKVKEGISYPEAKRRLSGFQRGSFVEAVRRGPAPPTATVGTQVSFSELAQPLRSPGPRLRLQLPGRSISAAQAAAAPSHSKGSGAPTEEMEATPSQTESTSSRGGSQNPPKKGGHAPSRTKGSEASVEEMEVTPSQTEGASSQGGPQNPPKRSDPKKKH